MNKRVKFFSIHLYFDFTQHTETFILETTLSFQTFVSFIDGNIDGKPKPYKGKVRNDNFKAVLPHQTAFLLSGTALARALLPHL